MVAITAATVVLQRYLGKTEMSLFLGRKMNFHYIRPGYVKQAIQILKGED
jgi:hypothetical protein